MEVGGGSGGFSRLLLSVHRARFDFTGTSTDSSAISPWKTCAEDQEIIDWTSSQRASIYIDIVSHSNRTVAEGPEVYTPKTGSRLLTNLTVSVFVPCELRTVDDLTDSLPGEVVDYIRHGAHFVFILSLGLAYSGLNKETSWKKPENRGYLRGMGAS
ncbi:hypothetical protein INR49_017466 [Caranx melampygus]|nr:hypothetical protein INR49_017466 [Caranx melampygus]